jgi:hypothetical protein
MSGQPCIKEFPAVWRSLSRRNDVSAYLHHALNYQSIQIIALRLLYGFPAPEI